MSDGLFFILHLLTEKALQNSHSSPVPSGTMMMKQFVDFPIEGSLEFSSSFR
jgi:hypothetical protein